MFQSVQMVFQRITGYFTEAFQGLPDNFRVFQVSEGRLLRFQGHFRGFMRPQGIPCESQGVSGGPRVLKGALKVVASGSRMVQGHFRGS